ncbi:hypothetical protein GCM10010911_33560 [Paenibacillus nasutitermitis]|uniref:Uncharacterized protein n=1 Tax=Paenibacillus nasutitermitis TaxID=1652958 RepID=A0A916Z4A9_9BACL|nr:hypothetical protein GCM10010911_33560 [Paenibacillus nasutitermitis]
MRLAITTISATSTIYIGIYGYAIPHLELLHMIPALSYNASQLVA